MPREICDKLHAEEQQQLSRKRKQANSGSYTSGLPAIHTYNVVSVQPDTTSTNCSVESMPATTSFRCALEGLGMQDDVAEEHFAWHGSRVRRQALKEEYDVIRNTKLVVIMKQNTIND